MICDAATHNEGRTAVGDQLTAFLAMRERDGAISGSYDPAALMRAGSYNRGVRMCADCYGESRRTICPVRMSKRLCAGINFYILFLRGYYG